MPTPPLDPAERRRRLARMIRVDHAGEFGAQQINELRADPAERELADDLERFRQEEADHRDLATARGGTETAGYGLLRGVIRRGCKTAIWLSERL